MQVARGHRIKQYLYLILLFAFIVMASILAIEYHRSQIALKCIVDGRTHSPFEGVNISLLADSDINLDHLDSQSWHSPLTLTGMRFRGLVGFVATIRIESAVRRSLGFKILPPYEAIGDMYITEIANPSIIRRLVRDRPCQYVSVRLDEGVNEVIRSLSIASSISLLSLRGSNLDTTTVEMLSGLPQVGAIDLGETSVKSRDIKIIGGMRRLTGLFLDNTHISDLDISYLMDLRSLRTLDLSSTRISPRVRLPTECKSLVHLKLNHTRTDDNVVQQIILLPQLEVLEIQHTGITDDGLSLLANLRCLRRIVLSGSKVSTLAVDDFVKLTGVVIVN